MGNKFLQYFSLTLTVIGAINWGLIGFFNLNLVALLFGSMSLLSRIIYGLVGLCGLYLLSFYGLLTISDSFVTHEELSSLARQESFENMMKIALEAC